jgi:hypothetical protein
MFFLSLTIRYLLYYLLAAGLMFAAAVATGYSVGGIIGGLIPTMFGSLMCGVAYARRTGSRAPSEVAWGAATLFVVVTSVGGTALFLLLAPGEVRSHLIDASQASPTAMLLIALFALFVAILASRIFFGLGSRTWHAPARA